MKTGGSKLITHQFQTEVDASSLQVFEDHEGETSKFK